MPLCPFIPVGAGLFRPDLSQQMPADIGRGCVGAAPVLRDLFFRQALKAHGIEVSLQPAEILLQPGAVKPVPGRSSGIVPNGKSAHYQPREGERHGASRQAGKPRKLSRPTGAAQFSEKIQDLRLILTDPVLF